MHGLGVKPMRRTKLGRLAGRQGLGIYAGFRGEKISFSACG
jgi:hypothetical protein